MWELTGLKPDKADWFLPVHDPMRAFGSETDLLDFIRGLRLDPAEHHLETTSLSQQPKCLPAMASGLSNASGAIHLGVRPLMVC